MKTVQQLIDLGTAIRGRPETMITEVERYIRMRDRNGEMRALIANQAQRAFEDARGERANIVLKARQMGMTTWIAARMFMKTITARGVLTVQVAHTREAAEGIFRMVQRFWEHLPDDLRDGPLRRSRANVGQMCFPELDSEFRILSAGDPGAGRGLSIQNLHLSEVSQWPGEAHETLAGLRAALAPTGEIVIESTPRGAYGCFYEEWNRAEESGAARHFFPWWMEPAYLGAAVEHDAMTDDERTLVAQHSLTPQQIGFRRTLESSFHQLRAQEYAEDAVSCFLSSGDCCFDTAAIMRRIGAVPVAAEIRGATQIWLPPQPGRSYIVGVDTAGGGSRGDYSAVQVIERESGLQCAEVQEKLAPQQLAALTVALATEYNHATIAVERNNHGSAVLAHLGHAKYANVYAANGQPGWLTSLMTKPTMIARLGTILAETPQLFYSHRLLSEMRSYITQPNGGTGAAQGAHDDCVMAMAVAQAVRAEVMVKRGLPASSF
jgi:hypothetical protein